MDWRALKQHIVTTYTTEAELLAVSEAAKSLIWWKRVFAAIGFYPKHQMQIRCDNKQIMALLSKEDHHVCLKLQYVDIHQHWLRQKVQKGSITVNWVPITQMPRKTMMPADGFTKLLPPNKHNDFM